MDHLLTFAYQLRKQDNTNMHTNLLLSEVVKPPILSEIILANYWDHQDQSMKCDLNQTFKLQIGINNSELKYLNNHFKNFSERPRIFNPCASYKQYTEDLHLLLTPKGGIQICSKLMICILGVQRGNRNRGERDIVSWNYGQTSDKNLDSRFAADQTNIRKVWHLQNINQGTNDPYFMFTMVGKEGRQRLTAKNENPSNSSEIFVSSKGKEGFGNMNRTVW